MYFESSNLPDIQRRGLSDHREENLIASSLIVDGDSRYHWKGEIVNEKYYNIHAYTLKAHKQEIIDKVREIHSDETPIIEYTEIDGNDDFLEWIEENV